MGLQGALPWAPKKLPVVPINLHSYRTYQGSEKGQEPSNSFEITYLLVLQARRAGLWGSEVVKRWRQIITFERQEFQSRKRLKWIICRFYRNPPFGLLARMVVWTYLASPVSDVHRRFSAPCPPGVVRSPASGAGGLNTVSL